MRSNSRSAWTVPASWVERSGSSFSIQRHIETTEVLGSRILKESLFPLVIIALVCTGCTPDADPESAAAGYRPTAAELRPASERELRRYLIEGSRRPVSYYPNGRWQISATVPIRGSYQLAGNTVCVKTDGHLEKRCASLSIGPDGPVMSAWIDAPT